MRNYWQSWARTQTERQSYQGLTLWLAAAIAINIIAFALTHTVHRPVVAMGAALDVAVTVPALYFWLVVRTGAQPIATMIPLSVLALLRASYIAPGGDWVRPAVAGGAELAVTGFLIVRLRRGLRVAGSNGDPLDRLRAAMREILPLPAAASVGATEAAIFYYAFAWRERPHLPEGARTFTMHQRSGIGMIFGVVAGASLVEAALVHLMVTRWNVAAAWTLTALSLYGAVWLTAVARSFALRPSLAIGDTAYLRRGLLAEARVPRTKIAAVTEGAIEFTEPVEVVRMYGFRRRVMRIAIELDDVAGFRAWAGLLRPVRLLQRRLQFPLVVQPLLPGQQHP